MLQNDEIQILHLIGKWGFLLSRHLKGFLSYSSTRTFYRRIKRLLELGYLKREYLLYGVPPFYTLTHKGRIFIGLNKRNVKIRLDQVNHDILVLDTVLYLIKKKSISMEHITSEKELHSQDGFGSRKHYPDFVIESNGQSFAYEIELSLKPESRLEENVRLNYINYDYQIWVIEKENKKLRNIVETVLSTYHNASILYSCEVLKDD
jgi:hypothetical protein